MEEYFIDGNEIKREEEKSPSGKFKLLIRYYKTKEGYWNYSRGTVYRQDGTEICDIKRNYSTFHHSFVVKDGQEWLITGRSYMSQTIVNLETGMEYEDQHDKFCWADHYLSPDGNTLAVCGCYWAAPYKYKFFDFADPSNGWKELEVDETVYDDDKKPIWNKDGTITCYTTEQFYLPLNKFDHEITLEELDVISDEDYDNEENFIEVEQIRTTYRRVGDKLEVIDKWVSDDMKKKIEERCIANEKWNSWWKTFQEKDFVFLAFVKFVNEYKLPIQRFEDGQIIQAIGRCFKGWSETSDGSETCVSYTFLVSNKPKIRLEWGVEKEKIKVINGKKVIWFDHSVMGMVKALKYIKRRVGFISRILAKMGVRK